MSATSKLSISTTPKTSPGRLITIATIKAKDAASAARLEVLLAGCRDFALSSEVSTCHTYRTVRSIEKKEGVTTFVVFEEWDDQPDAQQTYFESDAIKAWNKAMEEEDLLAEPWEEPPPIYEEFIHIKN